MLLWHVWVSKAKKGAKRLFPIDLKQIDECIMGC